MIRVVFVHLYLQTDVSTTGPDVLDMHYVKIMLLSVSCKAVGIKEGEG